MPALNFMKQFAEDVEWGIKRQTVRALRKDGRAHCKVGDRLRLYTGMRTKGCRLLGEATVLSVEPVLIEGTCMSVNGTPLFSSILSRDQPGQTDNEFAEADGFGGFMEMADWFQQIHGLPFSGVVIRWDQPN